MAAKKVDAKVLLRVVWWVVLMAACSAVLKVGLLASYSTPQGQRSCKHKLLALDLHQQIRQTK